MTDAYPTAIFIIVPVEHVVTALDSPVAAIGLEHTFGIGFVGPSASDAVCNLTAMFTTFFLRGLPFDHEGLPHMGKVKVTVQSGGGPYAANLNPSVISGHALDEIRFLPVFEEEGKVVKECGLIPLHGEVVMGLAPHNVVGDVALSQKGVSGDVLALNGDGVKERDGAFDLVRAFDFFIAYPKTAYFFWVCEVFVS